MPVDDSSLVEQHEGFRATAYCDKCGASIIPKRAIGAWVCGCFARKQDPGNITVGIGTNLGVGITIDDARFMMRRKLIRVHAALAVRVKGWAALNRARQAALSDMAYTMGVEGVMGFPEMLQAIEAGGYEAAAVQMLNSDWAKHEAPDRAEDDARLMRTGTF